MQHIFLHVDAQYNVPAGSLLKNPELQQGTTLKIPRNNASIFSWVYVSVHVLPFKYIKNDIDVSVIRSAFLLFLLKLFLFVCFPNYLSLIHISEPTRHLSSSYAV